MENSFSKNERLILSNQYNILAELARINGDEDEEKANRLKATVLLKGYTHEYDEEIPSLNDEISIEDCHFVWDILEVYFIIQASCKDDAELLEKACFKGFDGNHESEYMDYCDFLVNDLGKYKHQIKKYNHDFNSHYESKPKYERMIAAWKKMGEPGMLTSEQIEELLNS